MPPSLISRLDPRLRQLVDRLIQEGRASIDDILTKLEELLGEGEEAPSRASVGRYFKNKRKQMERYREAQAIAATWVKRLEDEPGGDIGRLNAELLRTLAFQAISRLSEQEDDVGCDEIALMARAVKDIATADKSMAEREIKIRKEIVTLEAKSATSAATKAGLSEDVIRTIEQEVLKIA
jgi:hypothetical protein